MKVGLTSLSDHPLGITTKSQPSALPCDASMRLAMIDSALPSNTSWVDAPVPSRPEGRPRRSLRFRKWTLTRVSEGADIGRVSRFVRCFDPRFGTKKGPEGIYGRKKKLISHPDAIAIDME